MKLHEYSKKPTGSGITEAEVWYSSKAGYDLVNFAAVSFIPQNLSFLIKISYLLRATKESPILSTKSKLFANTHCSPKPNPLKNIFWD